MEPVSPRTLELLGCPACPADRPPFAADGACVRCPHCPTTWAVGPHGAVNSLTAPSASVRREIQGMRDEHPGRFPTLDSFLFQHVQQVSRFEDRIAAAAKEGGARNYYRSTEVNFRYAFDRLGVTGAEAVLEVGAEHDFPFLQPFRDRGCECFATNLFFCHRPDAAPGARVVLGDMNRLPFKSASFDVVLLSAASHHSPDLPGLLAELARVTKPGGRVLLLNDPTAGLAKHLLDRFGLGTPKGGDRHADINENEYSAAEYHRLAQRNGFDIVESFFSVYYDQKLRSGRVAGVRFAPLAKLVSVVWRVPALRALLLRVALYPGQMLIGLELNLILRKRATGHRRGR